MFFVVDITLNYIGLGEIEYYSDHIDYLMASLILANATVDCCCLKATSISNYQVLI